MEILFFFGDESTSVGFESMLMVQWCGCSIFFWRVLRGPTVNPEICGTKSEVKPFKRCEL